MPTFHTTVLPHQVRSDKTIRVLIRVTQHKRSRYIDTGLVATTADLTKEGKLKTQAFKDEGEEICRQYRDRCNLIPRRMQEMDVDQVVHYLTDQVKPADLDFLAFADAYILGMQNAGRSKSASNYRAAVNALRRFIAQDRLPVADITTRILRDFAAWIPAHPASDKPVTMSRAPSLYLSCIRRMHNEMKLQYNDEDGGRILVPGSPFERIRLPKFQQSRKRAITAEEIKAIYDMPRAAGRGSTRINLARDCFMLSFFLVGMNSADLYDCRELSGNPVQLRYYRKKTRGRRDDNAEMLLRVPDEAVTLCHAYRDPTGARAFRFYQMYRDESTFNAAINKGLKKILPDLEFYAARHSWASIAQNKAGVDKYLVHEALNHLDPAMKVTDMYLEKDWSRINEANRRVIDYVMKIHL